MARFFSKDPALQWEKVMCVICGQPSGPESRCYENVPEKIPIHKRKIVTGDGIILPIYSPNCAYREDNLWQGIANYPISEPMIARFKQIEGVERIFPIKAYTFRISVGKLFDQKNVMRAVTLAYNAFIKECQALEINKENGNDLKEIPKYLGIKMPNGQEFKTLAESTAEAVEQSNVIGSLLRDIPAAQPIV